MKELPIVPSYFPEIEYPVDNQYSMDRWKLGKKLFYDPILSIDSSISCASCHKPELAFADNISISKGVENREGNRNSPSLANVAYHPYYTREGGVPTLEMQILVPIQEHAEFDFNIVEISGRLNKIQEYVDLSMKAYEREPDHYVITRSIACFERTLISGRSKYDSYLFYDDISVLSLDEQSGMELFFSDRFNCSSCHGGFDFSDYTFKNNGLYEQYIDEGRYRLTKDESDKFLFKTPSLRNVALTFPYMHDGSLVTLEEVVDHYSKGGAINSYKSKEIKEITMTDVEKRQLIAFLKTLTDNQFIQNPLNYEE